MNDRYKEYMNKKVGILVNAKTSLFLDDARVSPLVKATLVLETEEDLKLQNLSFENLNPKEDPAKFSINQATFSKNYVIGMWLEDSYKEA